jgi:hypothetical protein
MHFSVYTNIQNSLKFTIMKRTYLSIALALLSIFMVSGINAAPIQGTWDHPAYLHALSDLRAARWMIEHKPGDWQRTIDEEEAVNRIDKAIGEIKKAAIDDHKDINDHPRVDEHPDHAGRLHDALDFLRKARKDISEDEDNAFAQGLQARAYMHIDKAIDAVKRAIHQ